MRKDRAELHRQKQRVCEAVAAARVDGYRPGSPAMSRLVEVEADYARARAAAELDGQRAQVAKHSSGDD